MEDLRGIIEEGEAGRIDRRAFLARAAGAGLALPAILAGLEGCARRSTATGTAPAPMSTQIPDTINLFNWSAYSSPAMKDDFERIYGVAVRETFFDDNESMLAQLTANPAAYDVIVPSDYMVSIMRRHSLLRALDMSFIPEFKNVMNDFQALPFDPGAGGVKYTVPYQWGTTGIGVRLDKVGTPIRGWADLWRPEFQGRISMLNDEREVLGAGLMKNGFSENSTKQSELDEATADLITQKALVKHYDSANMTTSLVDGLPLVHTWDGAAKLAISELGEDVCTYVLPAEGFTMWVDNLAIPKDAPNPYAAHLFINFACEPRIAAELVAFTKYQTPNAAAVPMLSRFQRRWIPTRAQLTRRQIIDDLGPFSTAYDAAWEKLRSS